MDDGISAARKRIEKQMEDQEEARRRKLLHQRIDIARQGVIAFQKHRVGDAVKAFHMYLHILEDLKNCNEGGLLPHMFDVRRDIQELLLISGVYWDMVKLYDRAKGADKKREFMHYLEKYILFSKGMPFQVLCAETLRKYISNEKPIHTLEFKNAYRMIANSKCFVATSLIDVSAPETLPRLREFRGRVLMRSTPGRAFVQWYYTHGPALARVADRMPRPLRRILARALDLFARKIR
ncbi:MAG: CFI-box-CTERM domain-containing protein [Bdellovibrionota bacterium]